MLDELRHCSQAFLDSLTDEERPGDPFLEHPLAERGARVIHEPQQRAVHLTVRLVAYQLKIVQSVSIDRERPSRRERRKILFTEK